jgi:hypothetical protein
MPISLEDLDGTYNVTSETSYGGPFFVNGDGVTVIKNGLTYRKDKNGFIWESSFSVIGEDKIEIESTVDPSHATDGAFIIDQKGNPTKGIVTYKSTLDVRQMDGKIVMSGIIQHGKDTTRLVMKQV